MKTLAPLIERIEADIMASDLLMLMILPSVCWMRRPRNKRPAKRSSKGKLGFTRDQQSWVGQAPPNAFCCFPPIAKARITESISPVAAALYKPTPVRDSGTHMSAVRMKPRGAGRPPAGRIRERVSTRSGPP